MNIQIPPETPVIDIIRFAASLGCVVKYNQGGVVFEPRKEKANG